MKILSFPEFRQTFEYDCGAKALQSVLVYYGVEIREELLMKKAGTNKNGTPIDGIKKTAEEYGLKVEAGEMNIDQIKKYINKKIPVIILLQAWSGKKKNNYKKDWNDGHYVVAIGYDKNHLYFEDPYSVLRTYLSFKEINDRWHDETSRHKRLVHMGIAIYGKSGCYNLSKPIHMK